MRRFLVFLKRNADPDASISGLASQRIPTRDIFGTASVSNSNRFPLVSGESGESGDISAWAR